VQGCAEAGFQTPLDVRWLRLDRASGGRDKPKGLLTFQNWTGAVGLGRPAERTCSCGQDLPGLQRCVFILSCGRELEYLLGQCRRCRTIFWQQL